MSFRTEQHARATLTVDGVMRFDERCLNRSCILQDAFVLTPTSDTLVRLETDSDPSCQASCQPIVIDEQVRVYQQPATRSVAVELAPGSCGGNPPTYRPTTIDAAEWSENVRILGAHLVVGGLGAEDIVSAMVSHSTASDTRTANDMLPGETRADFNGMSYSGVWSASPLIVGASLQNCLNPPPPNCDGTTHQCIEDPYPLPPRRLRIDVQIGCQ